MTFPEFVENCDRTIFEECKNFNYLYGGLASEIGEVFGKIKKRVRNDVKDHDKYRMYLALEIGDCLWYIAMLHKYCFLNIDVSSIWDSLYSPKMVDTAGRDFFFALNLLPLLPLEGKRSISRGRLREFVVELRMLSGCIGFTLEECGTLVIEKLRERAEAGTIRGDGDGVNDRTVGGGK